MSRTRKIGVPSAMLLGVLALAGCSQTDPYERAGVWRPSDANSANIAAQVANPADLVRGREARGGSVRVPTAAVERVWVGAPAQRPQGGQGGAQGGRQGGGGERPSTEATR